MAAPFATLESDITAARDTVARVKRRLATAEREARLYDDEIDYPAALTNELRKWRAELTKAENKLKRLTKRKGNPVAKKKRKATPAQLRALKKGRATAARNRRLKKKVPKRKKVTRRNPAYGNYQTARMVARGSRAVNPVRKLSPLYAIKAGGRYFDGVRFSAKVSNAARFATLQHCKSVAQKIADKTGKSCSIVNLRK